MFLKKEIKKKIFAVFLLLAFFIFVCENSDILHFHKLPDSCDLCKIVFINKYYFISSKVNFTESNFNDNTYFLKYFFLNTFEELPFSLRAPPRSV